MAKACELNAYDGAECGNEDNLKAYLLWANDVRITERLCPDSGTQLRWVAACPSCALRVLVLGSHGGILEPETDQRYAQFLPTNIDTDDESHIVRGTD